jgi:hypothetical protein
VAVVLFARGGILGGAGTLARAVASRMGRQP